MLIRKGVEKMMNLGFFVGFSILFDAIMLAAGVSGYCTASVYARQYVHARVSCFV